MSWYPSINPRNNLDRAMCLWSARKCEPLMSTFSLLTWVHWLKMEIWWQEILYSAVNAQLVYQWYPSSSNKPPSSQLLFANPSPLFIFDPLLSKCSDTLAKWTCEFCNHENEIVALDSEEIPKSDTCDYVLEPATSASTAENVIIFCIDISGCVFRSIFH